MYNKCRCCTKTGKWPTSKCPWCKATGYINAHVHKSTPWRNNFARCDKECKRDDYFVVSQWHMVSYKKCLKERKKNKISPVYINNF